MHSPKVTPRLADQLESLLPDDLVEVVIELRQQPDMPTRASRAEAIAIRRRSFEASAAPVEELVRELGGMSLERAWLNRSLRIMVRAGHLHRIAQLDQVALLDTTTAIESDSAT